MRVTRHFHIQKRKARLTSLSHGGKYPMTRNQSSKDVWDKLAVVASLVSGVGLATIGLLATISYNLHQEEAQRARDQAALSLQSSQIMVQRIQTVQSFFPYLTSGDTTKVEAALKSIAALGDDSLFVALAKLLGGKASIQALVSVASNGSSEVASLARDALTGVSDQVQSVVSLTTPSGYTLSGFAWGGRGRIITVAHQLHSLKDLLTMHLADGREARATITYINRASDLALVSCPEALVRPIEKVRDSLPVGAAVVSLGYLHGTSRPSSTIFYARGEDVLARLLPGNISLEGIDLNMRVLVVDGASPLGSEGSPVLTPTGELVGMVDNVHYRSFGYISFVIPIATIRATLVDGALR
jgi:S1-C subfamily serine protease